MSKTKKAGCILVNLENKTIALVYRDNYDDFSFPKGHLEDGETLEECAIRETAEETKRDCTLLEKEPIYIMSYITPSGEDVEVYYYLTKDIGPSDNKSLDVHDTYWFSFDEVRDKLSYSNLKKMWDDIYLKIMNIGGLYDRN